MDIQHLIIDCSIDAAIPLAGAFLLLTFPQWFTKADLTAPANHRLVRRFQIWGWTLLAVGVGYFIINLASALSKK